MGRAARWLALGMALAALVACSEQSDLAADAPVQVHGLVRDAKGAPLADRPVRLGSGVSDLEGGAGFLTAGLFCLSGACGGTSFDATTSADGTYGFELTGGDTQSTFGEAESFLLSTSAPPTSDHPTGAAIGARFRIQTEDLSLPELQLVDPAPKLSSAGQAVALQWDATVAPGPFDVEYVDRDDESVVWAAGTTKGGVRIDGRVLEDSLGRVTVGGSSEDAVEGSDIEVTWVSPSIAFAGGLGAPPSRGATCTAIGEDGTSSPMADCPLTDGSFTASAPATQRARITLRAPVPADLAVVRGCEPTCQVSVIPQGAAAPIAAGTASGPFATVALDGSPIVAVDVELPAGSAASLREVSVWAPAPAGTPALRDIDDPAAVGGLRGAASDDTRRWWSLAAGALILLTVLALGIAIGRRRRPA